MLRPSPTKLLAMLCLFCLLAGAMTRCTSRPVQPYVATEPRNEAIYVIVGGWHTELALPMPAISVRLAALKLGFGNARYLVFGWGARDYYMSRDPGTRGSATSGGSGTGSRTATPTACRSSCRDTWRRTRKGPRAASALGLIPEASFMPRPEPSISRTPATPGRQRRCALPGCPSARWVLFMQVSSSSSSRRQRRQRLSLTGANNDAPAVLIGPDERSKFVS